MTLYADGPEIDVDILITAPPATVWQIVADPALPARHSSELQEASWGEHPSGVPGLGSIIEGRNTHELLGEWTTESIVTEWDPERAFAWAVGDVDDSAARWRFDLNAEADGTRLRQHYRIGPGSSGVSFAIDQNPDQEERIIADRLIDQARNMTANLEAVKAAAEA